VNNLVYYFGPPFLFNIKRVAAAAVIARFLNEIMKYKNESQRKKSVYEYMKKVCREQEKFICAHRCHACMLIEFGSALLFLHWVDLFKGELQNDASTAHTLNYSDDTLLAQQEIEKEIY
jgi:hypothetical protein